MLKHRYGVRTEYPLWLLVCCSIVHRHFNWIQLLLCCRSVYCSSFRFLTTTGLPILVIHVHYVESKTYNKVLERNNEHKCHSLPGQCAQKTCCVATSFYVRRYIIFILSVSLVSPTQVRTHECGARDSDCKINTTIRT
jgi:hypothetical protein